MLSVTTVTTITTTITTITTITTTSPSHRNRKSAGTDEATHPDRQDPHVHGIEFCPNHVGVRYPGLGGWTTSQ